MRCKICNRIRRLFPDDICSQCYYTVNGKILSDYMTEAEIIYIVREWSNEWKMKDKKKCNKCGVVYPKSLKYFYSNGSRGYVRPTCRGCYNK